MADAIQIDLPRSLHVQVKSRALVCRYPDVPSYIISLIKKDLAEPKPARRVTVSRETFQQIRKRLLDGMMSYMAASEQPGYGYTCGYQLKHIDRCAAITRTLQSDLATKPKPSPERVLKLVKGAVVKLNKLNASCDGTLIETDQREDLCQLLLVAAKDAGLKINDDITEQWRAW